MRFKIYEGESEKKQLREKRNKELSQLRRLLKNGVVEFKYKKKDGSTRKARGTLKASLLPETDKDDERTKNTSKDCFYYYDLDKSDYRAFLRDNYKGLIKEKKEK
jgi:hypothetical protein